MSLERFQICGAPTNRVAYPRGLFVKTLVKGADDIPTNWKYNALILIPKDDEAKVDQLLKEYDAAFKELQGSGYKGKTVDSINPKNNCLIDGDIAAEREDNKDALKGYYVLKVASKNFRPIVADANKLIITNGEPSIYVDPERMSPHSLDDGDYVFANISFWSYNHKSFQGIGCNIHAVIRASRGEPIGGAFTKNVADYIDMGDYKVEEDDNLPF